MDNHPVVVRSINSHGYTSPYTVLHFDKFDLMAEFITSWVLEIGKPFTVIING